MTRKEDAQRETDRQTETENERMNSFIAFLAIGIHNAVGSVGKWG